MQELRVEPVRSSVPESPPVVVARKRVYGKKRRKPPSHLEVDPGETQYEAMEWALIQRPGVDRTFQQWHMREYLENNRQKFMEEKLRLEREMESRKAKEAELEAARLAAGKRVVSVEQAVVEVDEGLVESGGLVGKLLEEFK